jgi:HSP20 family protein
MAFEEIKHNFSSFWDSVAEGWQQLRRSASNALTGFTPSAQTNMPAHGEVDDSFFVPALRWSMLGGDVFEDDKRVVVRLEVPGVDKNDLDIEVQGDTLTVRGEKRFERENTQGRYRVLQCAYGGFTRAVPLPAKVLADKSKAEYKNGVLRIELPKAELDQPRRLNIKVS